MKATESPAPSGLDPEQFSPVREVEQAPPARAVPQAADEADCAAAADLTRQLARLSHKQGKELLALRRGFVRLGKADKSCPQWLTLRKLLEKNRRYQRQLQEEMQNRLALLREALDAGRSREAFSQWNRIQTSIGQCTGQFRQSMQREAEACKAPLLALRGWRNYAAARRKQELIEEMAGLPAAGLPPAELSRHIQHLHEQWKNLGDSDQNAKLWREFKRLSDQARAPCVAYFRERKLRMARNLEVRTELCAKLEQQLSRIEGQPVHILKLNQLIRECDASWKQHAPVEPTKIKPLRQRYHSLLKQLTSLRKRAMAENTQRKQHCLAQLTELAQQEDLEAAAAQSRNLQSEWKRIGPAEFAVEKTLRADFAAALEKLSAALREHRKKQQERARPAAERNHEALLAQLKPQAEMLTQWEVKLLEASTEPEFSEHRAAARGKVQEPMPDIDAACAEALSRRLRAISQFKSATELNAEAEECERRQRRACVQLEILVGMASPQADQDLRMELQLRQLASHFGKRQPDRKQLAADLRAAELALTCDGPLRRQAREDLWRRLRHLRQRINSRARRAHSG